MMLRAESADDGRIKYDLEMTARRKSIGWKLLYLHPFDEDDKAIGWLIKEEIKAEQVFPFHEDGTSVV
eukprot:m.258545 g.258545  ORF g.258545 m.258545 type:complete len:68 (-) comp31250_c0_seq1:442-645(-)